MPKPLDLLTADRPETLQPVRTLLDRAKRGDIAYHPSPIDWRDEVLYFLLPDRFSDGRESTRTLLDTAAIAALRQASGRPGWSWKDWAESGKRWQGGTIAGIRGKLDYLKALGITTLWVGPVFQQRVRVDSYHGYGIQDFLDVDPRFGTRRELAEMIEEAHARGLRVILDIIVNHTGDNWGYVSPGKPLDHAINEPAYRPAPDFYGNPHNPEMRDWRLAWRDEHQEGFTASGSALAAKHDGVWPRELQDERRYARAGKGSLGAGDIGDPSAEHKRTDFFSLKDIALDVPPSLGLLAECYQYWIAVTDCDGFRIDTVKHMALEETRDFCGAIREYADSLGKRNYFLVGEIAGGDFFQDFVLDRLAVLGRNLTAALDIGGARMEIAGAAKGLHAGREYLQMFKEGDAGFGSHRTVGSRHVSILDDHDHVTGPKVRFSAEIPDGSPVKDRQVAAATALQLFTLGIPCIYYGTEQAFAGPAESQRPFVLGEGWNDPNNFGDRYLREAMFGPDHPRANHSADLGTQTSKLDQGLPGFGPFGTAGMHCFNPGSPAYVRIAALCAARAKYLALRVGRQYPREIRLPHTGFTDPPAGELIVWSRLLHTQEAVVVVNGNGNARRGGDVVVSGELSGPGTLYTVVANTAHSAAGAAYAGTHRVGSTVAVQGESVSGEPAFLAIREVDPAEVLVLVRQP
ncbi:MAG: alpha-amylase family glycosyl hydrolase [Bryobacteraceae bacterium]